MNDATLIDADQLGNFRAKKEEFHNLREEAITRMRARIEELCGEFEIAKEELIGLRARKARGRKSKPPEGDEQ